MTNVRFPGPALHPRLAGLLLMALVALAGCASVPPSSDSASLPSLATPIPGVRGVPNLYRVDATLYRSALPTSDGLALLSRRSALPNGDAPIKTVLSLRPTRDKQVPPPLVSEHIRFWTWHPEDADVVEFLRIATTPALQPVLVHCQHGSDRTGMMVAIYRIAEEGWSKENAIREMTGGGFGFHSMWQNLIRYVNRLDVEAIKAEVARQGPWPVGDPVAPHVTSKGH